MNAQQSAALHVRNRLTQERDEARDLVVRLTQLAADQRDRIAKLERAGKDAFAVAKAWGITLPQLQAALSTGKEGK